MFTQVNLFNSNEPFSMKVLPSLGKTYWEGAYWISRISNFRHRTPHGGIELGTFRSLAQRFIHSVTDPYFLWWNFTWYNNLYRTTMLMDSNQLPRTIVEYQILCGKQETGVLKVEKKNK